MALYSSIAFKPHLKAMISGKTSWTFGKMLQESAKMKAFLLQKGVKAGDHIGVLSDSSPQFVQLLLAIWQIKAVACILNSRNPHPLLQKQLDELRSRILISDQKSDLQTAIPSYSFDEIMLSLQKDVADNSLSFDVNQLCDILYTSGSSSEPKAVVHTFGNHYYNANGVIEFLQLSRDDRWLLSLPLYHVGGLSICFRSWLANAAIIIPEKIEKLKDSILRYEPSHISLVPTQLMRLLETEEVLPALKKMKGIMLGGGPSSKSLLRKCLDKALPVYQTYGLTEMSSQVATAKLTDHPGEKGLDILPYSKVIISKEEEILCKGESLFAGYWKDNTIVKSIDKRGWFHTRDTGKLSDNGRLIVHGRLDNMFISGGENISSEGIEKHLLDYPGIKQAMVIGITHKEFGKRPLAFLDFDYDMNFSLTNLKEFLSHRLAKFMLPDAYYLWPKDLQAKGLKIARKDFVDYFNDKKDLQQLKDR